MPIGALISAGASLIGGALNRKAQAKRDKQRENFERTRIQTVAADAKAAGIHPLAALGVASGYQNPYGSAATGSTLGDGIADAGQQLGTAVRQKMADKKQQPLLTKQENLLDAQIIESQSRTMLNEANAKRALVGPAARLDPFAPRKENALIKLKLANGKIIDYYNPDVMDIGPTELVTGTSLMKGGEIVHESKRDKLLQHYLNNAMLDNQIKYGKVNKGENY